MSLRSARAERRSGQEQASDPRPARTREAIQSAFEALLAEKGYATMTVADVIAAAGVSRSVFYQHFASLNAVASACVDELFERIARHDREERVTTLLTGHEIARGSLTEMLQHIERNTELFQYLLAGGEPGSVRPGFVRRIRDSTIPVIRTVRTDFTADDVEMAAEIVAGGLAHGIVRWLGSGTRSRSSEFLDTVMRVLPEWLVAHRPLLTGPGDGPPPEKQSR